MTSSIPLQISSYHILPLLLPALPAAQAATHYLYLRPHSPKIPTPHSQRSLFLVNTPFDATETHIKALLGTQLGLPAGRIEGVRFEGERGHEEDIKKDGERTPNTEQAVVKRGKKRKRGTFNEAEGEIEDMEALKLPRTWDRYLHKAGGTTVVVFVDKGSMEAVIAAVKKARKRNTVLVWGDGLENKVPALGSARMLSSASQLLRVLIMLEMMQAICPTIVSSTLQK
jgi:ribosomal RNA-processing protein 7